MGKRVVVNQSVKPAPKIEGTITTEQIEVTPKLAMEWLEKNVKNNRSVSDEKVNQYASIMRAGGWHLTHQGIAFSVNDEMIDGQHRMWALVQSGCTIPFMVTRGLPKDAIEAIDVGRVRKLYDIVSILGENRGVSSKHLVARAIGIDSVRSGNSGGSVTKVQLDQIFEEYGKDLDWAMETIHHGGSGVSPMVRKLRSAPIVGALTFMHKKEPKKIEAFSERLYSGLGLTFGDPAHTLREVMAVYGMSGQRSRLMAGYMTVRAGWAAIEGKNLQVIKPAFLTRENPEFRSILTHFGAALAEIKPEEV